MADPGGASTFLLFLISVLIPGGKRQPQFPFLGIPVFILLVQWQPLPPGGEAVGLALRLSPGGGETAALSTQTPEPGLAGGWASSRPPHTAGHFSDPIEKEGGQLRAFPSTLLGRAQI